MNALRIEGLKLLRPATYVLAILLLLGFALIGLAILKFAPIAQDVTGLMKGFDEWQVRIISFLFCIFISMNIGNEYSENTLRRSIIEGYTRMQFFIGKILLVVVVSLLILVAQKSAFLASAGIAGHLTAAVDSLTPAAIFTSFIIITFYGFLAMFFAFLTRSVAISIVLYFGWWFLEGLLRGYLKFKFPEADYGFYLPEASLDQLFTPEGQMAFKFIALAVAYQAFFVVAALGLLLKRDIK